MPNSQPDSHLWIDKNSRDTEPSKPRTQYSSSQSKAFEIRPKVSDLTTKIIRTEKKGYSQKCDILPDFERCELKMKYASLNEMRKTAPPKVVTKIRTLIKALIYPTSCTVNIRFKVMAYLRGSVNYDYRQSSANAKKLLQVIMHFANDAIPSEHNATTNNQDQQSNPPKPDLLP